jgi:phosphate transport system permease protein
VAVGSFQLEGKEVTAFSQAIDGHEVAFGFSDGTVRFGRVEHKIEIVSADQVPEGLKDLDNGDKTDGSTIFSPIPGDQVRKTWIELTLEEGIEVSSTGRPIRGLDYKFGVFAEKPTKVLAALDDQGSGTLLVAESKLNLFTRKVKTEMKKTVLPPLPEGAQVVHVLVNELADSVYFAEKNGKVYRYNTREFFKPYLAETVPVIPAGVNLNVFGYLVGDNSIVVGGSDGSVAIYFLLRQTDATSRDGYTLVRTRVFERQPAGVTAFSPGVQDKTFATADASGNIWVRHGTSLRTLLRLKESGDRKGGFAEKIALSPRGDGLLAMTSDGQTNLWELNIRHPEVSLSTLLGKVWYEGYPEPTYTWQTTGATEAFEPKISLIPLIFGTLKATFYSLLFSIPIALLAAIYTSEFLPPNLRGKIKPSIEVMASIPSVVLGFIAAMVLAPLVESWIGAVVLAFVVLPTLLVLAGYVWQLLPPPAALRLEGVPKLCIILLTVLIGLFGAYSFAPRFESLFFDESFKAWVNGGRGGAAPFYFLLLLPISGVLVAAAASRLFGRTFNEFMKTLTPFRSAFLDLGRWLGIGAATVVVSLICAVMLEKLGFDPRGHFVGTYVQSNTLIVGFAMGFAVIPIMYTLAEDALNAVPDHLRGASLGCGATPWQTAIWIILPTAVSGVFSAVMIGMGRAVGETMIVVMSAGNTPLVDLNIFNGLRALSANIAVELPEAPKDATLYRVLFLTALVLFGMTFVINTVAEMVRIRFRKRSMQL